MGPEVPSFGILDAWILRFIHERPQEEAAFQRLALSLFAYQFDHNPPYQAYCRSLGKLPENISRWQEIPSVPVQAFKEFEIACFPSSQAVAVFHSSATTPGQPSRHYFPTLALYEASLASSFQKHVMEDQTGMDFLIFTPSPSEVPHSSLIHMLETVRRMFGGPASKYVVQEGKLRGKDITEALSQAQSGGKPVVLLGTTLAFWDFFDLCAARRWSWNLPEGSRIMDTGGMKARQRSLTRAEWTLQIQNLLGIPEERQISEYGMCEMSSQFYGQGHAPIYEGPAWVRTLVIDPLSGEPAAPGQTGLLRHWDLANRGSAICLQTDDLGRQHRKGFELLGRAPGAAPKGCSITVEQLLHE